MGEVFEGIKDSLTIWQVAEHFGFAPNRSGFISSPFASDSTPSCKLYDETNSFYDFSSNRGGDLVRFTALVLGINNWQAAKYLVEVFALPLSLSDSVEQSAEIERRKRERARRQERERRFQAARLRAIDDLHFERRLYELALDRHVFSPLSEQQAWAVAKLDEANYRLDILCGLTGNRADQEQVLKALGQEL